MRIIRIYSDTITSQLNDPYSNPLAVVYLPTYEQLW